MNQEKKMRKIHENFAKMKKEISICQKKDEKFSFLILKRHFDFSVCAKIQTLNLIMNFYHHIKRFLWQKGNVLCQLMQTRENEYYSKIFTLVCNNDSGSTATTNNII